MMSGQFRGFAMFSPFSFSSQSWLDVLDVMHSSVFLYYYPLGSQGRVFFSLILFLSLLFLCFFSVLAGGRMSCVLLDSSTLHQGEEEGEEEGEEKEGSQVSSAYNSSHWLRGSISPSLQSCNQQKSHSTIKSLGFWAILLVQLNHLFLCFLFCLFVSFFLC